jgi:mono/diheme cytochrome c family protein
VRLRSVCGLALALCTGTGPALAYQPKVNYQLQCMGCHHGDGAGEPGRVPSIRKTLVPFSTLPDGRDFVLRVPGVAQAPLSDADIAALLNWMVRNLSDVALPVDFVDYSADEVGQVRHQPLVGVSDVRRQLLERIATAAEHGGSGR